MPVAPGLGKDFRRLWLASGLSNLGDGVAMVALSLIAVRLTTSATLVAGVAVAVQLPQALATLPAGAIADRMDRRDLMIAANVGRAVAVALAAAVAIGGGLGLPALYAVALALGTASVIVDATAQSTVPMVVARERLSAGNGRLVGTQIAAQEFVGGPLAGLLVGLAVVLAFTAPALLYVAAAVVLLTMRGEYRPRRAESTRLGEDIAEGLRYLAGHRLLRTLAGMAALANLAGSGFFAIFVLFVVGGRAPMQLSEPAYGALLACLAAGAVVGALTAERAQRRLGRVRLLQATILGWTACFAVPAFSADVVVVAAALFLAGYVNMLANVIMVSLRQTLVPGHLLGRVNATMRLVGTGAAPLGAAIAGPVADLFGLRFVFLAAAGLILLAFPGFLVVTEAALSQAERDVEETRPHDRATTGS